MSLVFGHCKYSLLKCNFKMNKPFLPPTLSHYVITDSKMLPLNVKTLTTDTDNHIEDSNNYSLIVIYLCNLNSKRQNKC